MPKASPSPWLPQLAGVLALGLSCCSSADDSSQGPGCAAADCEDASVPLGGRTATGSEQDAGDSPYPCSPTHNSFKVDPGHCACLFGYRWQNQSPKDYRCEPASALTCAP